MRQGYNAELIMGENGQLFCVNLGADHCSEHEWGIKTIRESFGILPSIIDETKFGMSRFSDIKQIFKKTSYGLPRRKVQSLPDSDRFQWFKMEDGTEGFVFNKHGVKGWDFDYYLNCPSFKTDLFTAWSDTGFMVASKKPEDIAHLKTLYQGFEEKNIAIWLGGGGAFQNAGLIIALANQIPKDTLEVWEKADRETYETQQAAFKTGIEERLRKAGKGFFALNPKRGEDGSLRFWLNPQEQKENNFGWFTVDELEQWIKGKGPIPKGK